MKNSSLVWQTDSLSPNETENLGAQLGSLLKGGEVIELRSDLGGGKTTFVKGLVGGAGSQDRVTSPTFTLSRIYQAPNFEIQHFDFYRLNDPGILANQLAEAINNQAVVVIEWAKLVESVLPAERLSIEFQPVTSDSERRIISFNYSQAFAPMIAKLESEGQDSQP